MLTFSFRCNGTWRNEQWTVVGTTLAHTALSDQNDATYVSSPNNKNRVAVVFPIDTTSVPFGAKITSITVKVRCNKTGTNAQSLTVNVIPRDKTSCYTSRTIFPTTTITEYEVATYRFDARGRPWNRHCLNQLIIQAFSYSGVTDGVRVYEMYAVINYEPIPTVVVTSPTGTVLTSSPTVAWTYSHTEGDPQVSAEYRIYTATIVNDPTFNVDVSDVVFIGTVSGDITSVILPTSLDPDNYYVYVQATSSHGAQSVWTPRQFAVAGPAPGIPGDSDPTAPGGGMVTLTPNAANSNILLQMRDTSNMLSVQAASFETETDGHEYTTTNCAAIRDTSTFTDGVASLKMTASSAADMSVSSGFTQVDMNIAITARAQFKSVVTGRTCKVNIRFYDLNFGFLSMITGTGTDTTGTWTEIVVTGTTPATAVVYAEVRLDVIAPANAEVHNVDHVGMMYGTNSAWSNGGHTSRNILDSFTSDAENPAQSTGWLAGSAATLSRATTLGTGSNGSLTHKLVYNGLSPSIAYRATGTVFTTPTTGTDYTLNKPVGTTTGDLMIAYVSSTESGDINPPTGWVVVNRASIDDGTTDTALFVLKRTAGGAEPSSWAGTVTVSSARRYAIVVAYSGAADASLQFLAENTMTRAADTPLQLTSATVSNTDVNAWRVEAFAVNDDATGTLVANVNPPAMALPITYVSRATTWYTTDPNTTTYTINRPPGLASGDLMIAQVSVKGTITTIGTPTGWTLVNQVTRSDTSFNNDPVTMAVFKRTAGATESASWTSTLSSPNAPIVTGAVAYRNCDIAANQFIANGTSSSTFGNNRIDTATVTNTSSSSWRVSIFAAAKDTSNVFGWTSSETVERSDDDILYSYNDDLLSVFMGDSNGPVSTGGQSRYGVFGSYQYNAAVSWIGILKQFPTPPGGVANDTQRNGTAVGSSNPWLITAVSDSNAVAPLGNQTVTGVYTPGTDSDLGSIASWVGLIKPLAPVTAGTATATMASAVDISTVDDHILTLASNQVTYSASFLGSVAGTPYFVIYFYNANELLSSQVVQGAPYNSSIWNRTSATFTIPGNTTRIKGGVYTTDRAVNDAFYFDRVDISLGTSATWRSGTGRGAHPVWTAPSLQYADDPGTGFGAWIDLPGQTAAPPAFDRISGQALYTDNTIIPLVARKYRVKTTSYGLAGDVFVSPWGPESAPNTLTASNWWLKDIRDPTVNMALKVRAENFTVGKTNTSAVFQPLGEDYPLVLTEGYKADSLELHLVCDLATWVNLKAILETNKTLYLQSDVDHAWWVRPVGNLEAEVLNTRQRTSTPIRFVKVTFVEVKPEL